MGEKIEGDVRYLYNTIDSYVEVQNHGVYMGKKVDMKKLVTDLVGLGYKVELDDRNSDLYYRQEHVEEYFWKKMV